MSIDQQNKRTHPANCPWPEAGPDSCICKPESLDVAREVILAGQGRGDDGRLLPGCPPINPGGRPKTRMMRDALLNFFKKNPSALDKIIETAASKAMEGDYQYFREIRDMIDGKPAIAVTGEDGGPLEVNVTDARTKLVQDLL